MTFRAQVLGVNGWVDGGLFVREKDAAADARWLAERYGGEVRVTDADQTQLAFFAGAEVGDRD